MPLLSPVRLNLDLGRFGRLLLSAPLYLDPGEGESGKQRARCSKLRNVQAVVPLPRNGLTIVLESHRRTTVSGLWDQVSLPIQTDLMQVRRALLYFPRSRLSQHSCGAASWSDPAPRRFRSAAVPRRGFPSG